MTPDSLLDPDPTKGEERVKRIMASGLGASIRAIGHLWLPPTWPTLADACD